MSIFKTLRPYFVGLLLPVAVLTACSSSNDSEKSEASIDGNWIMFGALELAYGSIEENILASIKTAPSSIRFDEKSYLDYNIYGEIYSIENNKAYGTRLSFASVDGGYFSRKTNEISMQKSKNV